MTKTCLHPRCLQHSQDPFSDTCISFLKDLCSAWIYTVHKHHLPLQRALFLFLSGLSTAHTGTWKPSMLLCNPTDGCLAFLSISNHICYRGTTVAVLWNLFCIMILHDFAKRRNKKFPKPFSLLYGGNFNCDMTASLFRYETAILNIHFFSSLSLINNNTRYFSAFT